MKVQLKMTPLYPTWK